MRRRGGGRGRVEGGSADLESMTAIDLRRGCTFVFADEWHVWMYIPEKRHDSQEPSTSRSGQGPLIDDPPLMRDFHMEASDLRVVASKSLCIRGAFKTEYIIRERNHRRHPDPKPQPQSPKQPPLRSRPHTERPKPQ